MRPIDIGCGFYTSVAIFASAIVADCFTCPEILTVDDCPDAGAKEQDTSHRNALCLSAVWKVAAPGMVPFQELVLSREWVLDLAQGAGAFRRVRRGPVCGWFRDDAGSITRDQC